MPPASELIHAAQADAAFLCTRDRELDAQVERAQSTGRRRQV